MIKDVDYFNKGSNYANRIREQKIDIMHKTNLIEHHEDIMRECEAEVLTAINLETNGNGKKIFSNETMRQAELHKRLKTHGDYNESKQVVKANKQEIAESFIGIDFHQNMLRLVTAFLH